MISTRKRPSLESLYPIGLNPVIGRFQGRLAAGEEALRNSRLSLQRRKVEDGARSTRTFRTPPGVPSPVWRIFYSATGGRRYARCFRPIYEKPCVPKPHPLADGSSIYQKPLCPPPPPDSGPHDPALCRSRYRRTVPQGIQKALLFHRPDCEIRLEETAANGLGNDQAAGFAKRDGNAHANLDTIQGLLSQGGNSSKEGGTAARLPLKNRKRRALHFLTASASWTRRPWTNGT